VAGGRRSDTADLAWRRRGPQATERRVRHPHSAVAPLAVLHRVDMARAGGVDAVGLAGRIGEAAGVGVEAGAKRKRPDQDRGATWVEVIGFEPTAPSLRTNPATHRRSAEEGRGTAVTPQSLPSDASRAVQRGVADSVDPQHLPSSSSGRSCHCCVTRPGLDHDAGPLDAEARGHMKRGHMKMVCRG
jgi:hypothetical protein